MVAISCPAKSRVKLLAAIIIILTLSLGGLFIFRFALPAVWNFFVIDQVPRQSDVIIVLSGDTGRAEYGIKLFKMGYADKILFSGGGARAMRLEALSAGISEDHILLDGRSHSTLENAQNAAVIMKEQGLKSTMVVTSAYHTRRSSIIFSQFLPPGETIFSPVPSALTASTWWKDTQTVRKIFLEALKLVWHFLVER